MIPVIRAIFAGAGTGVVIGIALHSLPAAFFGAMAASAFTQAVDRGDTP